MNAHDEQYEPGMNDEETPEGYCDDCALPCYGVLVDEGIGAYEFWGQRGVHHDYVYKSNCCNAEILDQNPCCSECGKREIEDYGLCLACCEALV